MSDSPTMTTPVTPTETPAAAPAAKKGKGTNPYIWGTGRRKTAIARVRIKPGTGKFMVNEREVGKFFCVERDRESVHNPLKVTETIKSVDVFVNVRGGGITGQAGAVSLGLSRALAEYNPEFETKLRAQNLMTRDARKVERKKYGRSGARRRFQFSKR
jgi:small subunit ribosomal protein S9